MYICVYVHTYSEGETLLQLYVKTTLSWSVLTQKISKNLSTICFLLTFLWCHRKVS